MKNFLQNVLLYFQIMFENVKDLWQRQHKASKEDLQLFVMCNQEEVSNYFVFNILNNGAFTLPDSDSDNITIHSYAPMSTSEAE